MAFSHVALELSIHGAPPYASTHLTIMAAGTDEAFVLLLEGNTFPLKAHLDELGIAHIKNAQGKYIRQTKPLLLRDDKQLLAALSALLHKVFIVWSWRTRFRRQ